MSQLLRIVLLHTHLPGMVELQLDQHTNICGTNASGKTTLQRLVPMFYGEQPNRVVPKTRKKFDEFYNVPKNSSKKVYMQRLVQLDVIRGFAVLGLLLMNIFAFAYPTDYSHSLVRLDGVSNWLDTSLYNLQTLLWSGRFMALFNLLFGVSMLLILQTNDQAYLQRRLYWLCLFGLLHGVLLWDGDILLWYALTGLVIVKLGYLQLDSAALWRKAVSFFAVSLVMPILYMLYLLLGDAEPVPAFTGETLAEILTLQQGPYVAQLEQRLISSVIMLFAFILSLFWLIASVMLLGASLYKSGWFVRGYSNTTTGLLFAVALALSALTVLLDHATSYAFELNVILPWQEIAILLMALSFGSALIKCSKLPALQFWLAPCGRMAFTLYISQTLFMLLVFQLLAPDWYARLDRAALLGIATGTIVLQLIFARGYFSYFKQGPLEWCWRALSKKAAVAG